MGIASAVHEESAALAAARTLKRERHARLRQLQEFEDLLDSVESQNLERRRAVPATVMAEVARLARTIGIPAPAAVWTARSGARLHDALLAWQGALLDALRPHRLRFGDRFD